VYFCNNSDAITILCESLSKFIELETQQLTSSGGVNINPPIINI
jgi:hypothetical protein